MSDPDNHLAVLASVPNDLEAAMIVSTLAAHEVDATTTGEFTSGFRAEAPGEVEVLVRKRDLADARRVLKELTSRSPQDQNVADQTHVAPTPISPTAMAALVKMLITVLVVTGILRSCL